MYINKKNLIKSMKTFGKESPFDHCVINNFFEEKIAYKLESEFPDYNDKVWHEYSNAIEVKKACNNWNAFPSLTYKVFDYLNSKEFVDTLSTALFGSPILSSDSGLNGGGWHIHKRGGKLNTHLDYSLHPKLNLQRKLNIIIYLNSQWQSAWGGHLGLWGNKSGEQPGDLQKEIEPIFNRAIIFDTTQNSWHGLPNYLACPENQFRKSLAVYYLCEPPMIFDTRKKALFTPNEDQKGDDEVLKLIKTRANVKSASLVYLQKKK
jgi:Rps23 Pro-64 3,4-dihydroxylase Tpa1-like proline 4-hydroxylase